MSALRPSASAAKANPNAISVRIKSRDSKGTANQRAHDLRIGRQPTYVDPERCHLNRHLIPSLTAAKIRDICDDRREKADLARKRAVAKNAAVATVGIITFGIEAQKVMALLDIEKQDQLFIEVAEAVAKRLSTSLTGLSIHLDESAIHAHFQMPAVCYQGTPVSKIAVKKVLGEIQTLAAEIAGRYDPRIERGTPRLQREAAGAKRSETINRQVRQLHDDLPAEIAVLQAQVAVEQARYEKNRRLADRAADKAREEGQRQEKAKKNAEIYEKRAADAEAKLVKLDEELARLETIRSKIINAEARLAPLHDAMEELDRHEAESVRTAEAAARQNAEAEAARQMFGAEPEISALAILASGDEVKWHGYGRQMGGWAFEDFLRSHGLTVSTQELSDFRKVNEKLDGVELETLKRIENDFCQNAEAKQEFEIIKRAVTQIGDAVRKAGEWSLRFLDRVTGAAREMIEMSFNRLADAIFKEQPPALLEAPPPESARPFAELPKSAQAAVRKAKKPDGPSEGP